MSKWDEEKHPRDDDGKFTFKKTGLMGDPKDDRPIISPKEYAEVGHILMTQIGKAYKELEQNKDVIRTVRTFNCKYRVLQHGKNKNYGFIILRREELE